jgi:hypothetical protein
VKLDNETRTRITVTVTTDFDPADSTVELGVDLNDPDPEVENPWLSCTWQAPAVEASGKWTRRALTDAYVAGPDVTPDGATVLTAGRHLTQTRVTSGGDQIVAASTPIDVA